MTNWTMDENIRAKNKPEYTIYDADSNRIGVIHGEANALLFAQSKALLAAVKLYRHTMIDAQCSADKLGRNEDVQLLGAFIEMFDSEFTPILRAIEGKD